MPLGQDRFGYVAPYGSQWVRGRMERRTGIEYIEGGNEDRDHEEKEEVVED